MTEKREETKEKDQGPENTGPVGAEAQQDHLAKFLLENFQDEFGTDGVAERGGEGAGEMAVRLLRKAKAIRGGRLADELEVRRLLDTRVNQALNSFIRGMFHEYEVKNIRVKKERPKHGPSVLVGTSGDFVKLNAPEWLREKLLSIADPVNDRVSWAMIEDPKLEKAREGTPVDG